MRFTLVIASLLVACADAGPEIPTLELGGKADNFYSDVALEYEVSGSLPLELTAAQYADEQVRNDYVSRRLTAFGLYLTTFVTDKFRGIDINGDGMITEDEVFFRNEDYGGFHAMVRNFTVEPVEVGGEVGTYRASFTIDLAGPKDLVQLLAHVPGSATTASGVDFDLRMPKGVTVDPEGVPRGVIRRFDPADHTGELETVRCSMRALPEPTDAWPQFGAFVADGVYDITLFYGHDYNTPRYDLIEAREAFDHLRSRGFTPPVATFEELRSNSGPFVAQLSANGASVRVEVRVFHSDMFVSARREQHDLAIEELRVRDVFFYNGHAGPYYGFYLDASDAATVRYTELAEIPFDPNKQQLFIAQGCQTYSQYADMLYANPNKSEDNLDVIVTVNYSYGQGTLPLFDDLVFAGADGAHVPQRYYDIVGNLNRNWINSSYNVFYGVTGIDGNPQLHPYANVGSLGTECASTAMCGDASGNVCVSHGGKAVCAVYALGADACPDGATYGVFDHEGRTYGVCVKQATPPPPPPPPAPTVPVAGELVITEMMIDPSSLADKDGEWFEVYNASSRPITLRGCMIGDDVSLSTGLDGNAEIAPGAYATLARTNNAALGFTPAYVYGHTFQLGNRGDEIVLSCDGVVVDRVAYTGGIRPGTSRSLDPMSLDPGANDAETAFCHGVEVYAGTGQYSDRGTPGRANPACNPM